MKKAVIAAASILCAAAITLCGCSNKVVEEKDYFTLTDAQMEELLDLLEKNDNSSSAKIAAASAKSLFSSVSILAFHTVRSATRTFSRYTYTYSDELTCGSGVIVDLDKDAGDAYILTCCHVIYETSSNSVTYTSDISKKIYLYLYGQDVPDVNYTVDYSEEGNTYPGTSYSYDEYVVSGDDDYRMEATVVAASIQYDLALLKVSDSDVLRASNAVAATFAEEDEVKIGQPVYTIGNNLGDGSSVTAGEVTKDSFNVSYSVYSPSSLSSSYANTYRVIQTDAAINSGCGGGGMYNSNGELIGILSNKIYQDSHGNVVENTGYALPLSNVKRICKLMMDSANDSGISSPGITRGFLAGTSASASRISTLGGYILSDIDKFAYETAYTYAYWDETEDGYTLGIGEDVTVTGTAFGLEEGDIITHLTMTDTDGNTVEDLDITRKFLLDDAMILYKSGYTVTLTYTNGGTEGTKTVTGTTLKVA